MKQDFRGNDEWIDMFRDSLIQNRHFLLTDEKTADAIIEKSVTTIRTFATFIDPTPLGEATYAEAKSFRGDRKVTEIFLSFKNNQRRTERLAKAGAR